jgi:Protein of unknown function (DUF2867)
MYEIKKDEFERVPLRAHSFLAGVPLRTLYRVNLPGGRAGMSLAEINALTGFGSDGEMEVGAFTKMLFDLRGLIGRLFGWDEVSALTGSVTYLRRLSADDYARTQVEPGTPLGISRVLYRFDNEMLAEIVNRTVHCFWVMASERTATGYALYLAIYVRRLNWFTPIYMALITPVVKRIIYPAMIASVRRRWEQAFPAHAEQAHHAVV